MSVTILPVVKISEAHGAKVLKVYQIFLKDFSCPGKEVLFVHATQTISIFTVDLPQDLDGLCGMKGIPVFANSGF